MAERARPWPSASVPVFGTGGRMKQMPGFDGMHRLTTPQTKFDTQELRNATFGDPRMQCTGPNLGPDPKAATRKGPSANPLSAVRRSRSAEGSRGRRIDNRQRKKLVRHTMNKDRSLAEWQPDPNAVNQRSFSTGTAMKPKGERAFSGTARLGVTGWLQRSGGASLARHGNFCPLQGGTMARPKDARLVTSSIARIPPEKETTHGRWTPNEKYHGRVTNFDWLGVERGPLSRAQASRGRPTTADRTWEHHVMEEAAAAPRDEKRLMNHHGGEAVYQFGRKRSDVTKQATI